VARRGCEKYSRFENDYPDALIVPIGTKLSFNQNDIGIGRPTDFHTTCAGKKKKLWD